MSLSPQFMYPPAGSALPYLRLEHRADGGFDIVSTTSLDPVQSGQATPFSLLPAGGHFELHRHHIANSAGTTAGFQTEASGYPVVQDD